MGKVYDGIMGLVVGDALGVPFEFKKRDTFKTDCMTGYGVHYQPPGTWSDDSSMTLATMESIARLGKIEPDDIMNNFKKWVLCADFTPHNKVFDIGVSTQRAVNRYIDGVSCNQCGGDTILDNGNGALMRILPLAFVPCSCKEIDEICGLTHNHDISKTACHIYISIAKQILNFQPILNLSTWQESLNGVFTRIMQIKFLSREEIKSSGYVVDTLEAALWCLYHTNTYKECVLTAVNLGGDTDTVAAVAGGLAGILYGCNGERGIPNEWISQIARKDWIKKLCMDFENKIVIKQDREEY